jgi:hypothetical protein
MSEDVRPEVSDVICRERDGVSFRVPKGTVPPRGYGRVVNAHEPNGELKVEFLTLPFWEPGNKLAVVEAMESETLPRVIDFTLDYCVAHGEVRGEECPRCESPQTLSDVVASEFVLGLQDRSFTVSFPNNPQRERQMCDALNSDKIRVAFRSNEWEVARKTLADEVAETGLMAAQLTQDCGFVSCQHYGSRHTGEETARGRACTAPGCKCSGFVVLGQCAAGHPLDDCTCDAEKMLSIPERIAAMKRELRAQMDADSLSRVDEIAEAVERARREVRAIRRSFLIQGWSQEEMSAALESAQYTVRMTLGCTACDVMTYMTVPCVDGRVPSLVCAGCGQRAVISYCSDIRRHGNPDKTTHQPDASLAAPSTIKVGCETCFALPGALCANTREGRFHTARIRAAYEVGVEMQRQRATVMREADERPGLRCQMHGDFEGVFCPVCYEGETEVLSAEENRTSRRNADAIIARLQGVQLNGPDAARVIQTARSRVRLRPFMLAPCCKANEQLRKTRDEKPSYRDAVAGVITPPAIVAAIQSGVFGNSAGATQPRWTMLPTVQSTDPPGTSYFEQVLVPRFEFDLNVILHGGFNFPSFCFTAKLGCVIRHESNTTSQVCHFVFGFDDWEQIIPVSKACHHGSLSPADAREFTRQSMIDLRVAAADEVSAAIEQFWQHRMRTEDHQAIGRLIGRAKTRILALNPDAFAATKRG